MNSHLDQLILQELATLPEQEKAQVLTFVRFLRLGLGVQPKAIEQRFDEHWEQVKQRAMSLGITEEEINAEIQAYRQGK